MTPELRPAVERIFTPAAEPAERRIGVEIELIPDAGGRPVPPAALARGFDPAFVATARPSFEPGGQLELSAAPRSSVREAVLQAHRHLNRATQIARARGIRLDLIGVDARHDWPDVPLRSTKPRYLAMQRLFDAVGQDGRRMMRLTASLQVCVDLLPGRAGREQWLVANLAGPALAVAFGNSPGSPGPARSRTAIWRGVDLRRTGHDGRHLDAADPVGAYTAFAAAAERLPIPEAADPAYHLSTLFPPVRPRGGYLEVRYLDAQPAARLGEAVSTVAALLYEPLARREALALLLPRLSTLDLDWRAAAGGGCGHRADVLAIARAGMTRLPHGYLPDDLTDRPWAA